MSDQTTVEATETATDPDAVTVEETDSDLVKKLKRRLGRARKRMKQAIAHAEYYAATLANTTTEYHAVVARLRERSVNQSIANQGHQRGIARLKGRLSRTECETAMYRAIATDEQRQRVNEAMKAIGTGHFEENLVAAALAQLKAE